MASKIEIVFPKTIIVKRVLKPSITRDRPFEIYFVVIKEFYIHPIVDLLHKGTIRKDKNET